MAATNKTKEEITVGESVDAALAAEVNESPEDTLYAALEHVLGLAEQNIVEERDCDDEQMLAGRNAALASAARVRAFLEQYKRQIQLSSFATDELVEYAEQKAYDENYDRHEIEFDTPAATSEGDDGVWVRAWAFVSKEEWNLETNARKVEDDEEEDEEDQNEEES